MSTTIIQPNRVQFGGAAANADALLAAGANKISDALDYEAVAPTVALVEGADRIYLSNCPVLIFLTHGIRINVPTPGDGIMTVQVYAGGLPMFPEPVEIFGETTLFPVRSILPARRSIPAGTRLEVRVESLPAGYGVWRGLRVAFLLRDPDDSVPLTALTVLQAQIAEAQEDADLALGQLEELAMGSVILHRRGYATEVFAATEDTNAARYAALVAAVSQAQSGNIITLVDGAFTIEAPLTSFLAAGVTGVTIDYGTGATYHYTNNDDSVADYAMFPLPQPVGTFEELQSALDGVTASLTQRSIKLVRDITLTAALWIKPEKTLIPDGFWLIGTGLPTRALWFQGHLDCGRRKVFAGFGIGVVVGGLRNDAVYPEWWGLVNNNHDIAINCAINTSPVLAVLGSVATIVKLGARDYYVSRDLDLTGTMSTIKGCGSLATNIITTTAWVDRKWEQCQRWGDPNSATLVPNHGAVIWMGGYQPETFQNTFHTKVIGVNIDCSRAAHAHWDNYKISGISSRGWIEECSVVHDVKVTWFTGFGVGYDANRKGDLSYSPAVINGLDISSCWIIGGMQRTCVPLFIPLWANNLSARNITVNAGVEKWASSEWNVTDGTPPLENPPEHIMDYADNAVVAQGCCSLSDFHIEGTTIGILVPQNNGVNNVTLTNIKAWALCDRIRGAVYWNDGRSGALPPAGNHDWGYGTAVHIGKEMYAFAPMDNLVNRVTIHGVSSPLGQCPYLLRDNVYGVHLTMHNMGDQPNGAIGGMFSFYTRGNAYGPPLPPDIPGTPSTTPGPIYNYNAPSTDRTYFLGPIY